MSLVTTLVAAATYPARLAMAVSRLLLQLGHLSSPEGPILRRGGYAERLAALPDLLDRMVEDDGYVEKLLGPGGTLDQLVSLGTTLEEIRPRLAELAEVVPLLHEAVDDLARSAGPLAELANRVPKSRRKAAAVATWR